MKDNEPNMLIGGSFVFAIVLYLAIFYGDDQ